MRSYRAGKILAAGFVGSIIGATPAFAGLSATATISSVPDGADFDYTIQLHNTSADTPIGTFWFSWTPPDEPIEYDFLPSVPSSATGPDSWFSLISPGFPGTSIESYNYLGNNIAPGDTGTFQFTSSDSPLALQGTSILGFPILTSFIYQGDPEVGPDAEVTPVFAVPEPSSLLLGGIGYLLIARRRRQRQ